MPSLSLRPPPAIDDHVRMVHTTDNFATVVGKPFTSAVDGGQRVSVRWHRTGNVNSWDPAFLMPADSDPAGDPDEVRSGVTVSRRARSYIDCYGLLILEPGGVRREVSPSLSATPLGQTTAAPPDSPCAPGPGSA